ncbi:MAG: ABC transporter substrate-binding protein [Pseudomonadota bacterium]
MTFASTQLGRRLLGICVLALAALPAISFGQSGAAAVKIGYLGNMTGRQAASFGIPFKNGLDLALADIAASGVLSNAKASIDVQVLDTNSEVTKAVTAFNQFARQKLPIVISDSSSPIGQAVAPLTNDAKIVFLSGSGSVLENKGGFAFRFTDLDTPTGSVGKYLVEKGAKRIGVVVATDLPSFPTLAAATIAGLPTAYVTTQNITSKDTNFAAMLTNLKDAKIDALVLSVLPEQAGNIIQQMSQTGGFTNVLLAGTLATSLQTYTIAGKSATGLVFPQVWAPGGAKSAAFEAAYKKKYASSPTAYGAMGYQIGWIVAAAILEAQKSGKGLDGDALRVAIPAASNSELVKKNGIFEMSLSAKGEATSPGALATFAENGDIVRATK